MPPPAISPSLPPSVSPSGPPRRVAVIGGGISGLAAAHRLCELDPAADVTLFEASDRLGGVLQTDKRDGWLIERSADMFTTREPWALDLCMRIGIADELIETDARFRKAYVVRRGKLVPVPEGFTLMSPAKIWPIATTPLLSPLGKLRLAWEYFTPAQKDNADESLESFVVRRFGREAFDRLIQPLIGGIYTADPAKLSLAATLPQFLEMERKSGSLIRGMRTNQGPRGGSQESASGARYGLFVAPRKGMQRLVESVASRLPARSIRLNTAVDRIERANNLWQINIAGSSEAFDDVILATTGAVSSRLLQPIDVELSALVGKIQYAGCSVAVLGVRREQVAKLPPCFGFVVPAIESRRIIAGSFASVKFPGRAPDGKLLIRVFVGGALQPELGRLADGEIQQIVLQELRELIGLSGEPEFCQVVRWLEHMPQYHVGHLDLVQQIEDRAAAIPHFALAGNAYRGVGVPFCIHSGEHAAERVLKPAINGRDSG